VRENVRPRMNTNEHESGLFVFIRVHSWLTCFFLFAALCQAQQRIPIIFDTDIGDDIDDALALALALQSPELDVRAVTTVIDDTERRTRPTRKQLAIQN